MRSLVITAAILIFSMIFSCVTAIAPYIAGDTMPSTSFNQSTVTTVMEGGNTITTNSASGQDAYYNKNIDVIGMAGDIVSGTIFIGGRLHDMGMDWGLALAINGILGVLVLFDQLMYWGKIQW